MDLVWFCFVYEYTNKKHELVPLKQFITTEWKKQLSGGKMSHWTYDAQWSKDVKFIKLYSSHVPLSQSVEEIRQGRRKKRWDDESEWSEGEVWRDVQISRWEWRPSWPRLWPCSVLLPCSWFFPGWGCNDRVVLPVPLVISIWNCESLCVYYETIKRDLNISLFIMNQ